MRAINPRTGELFDAGYLYRCWQSLLRKAGIQNPIGQKQKHDYGWHCIRRTHGNSIDPRIAQLTLGHSSLTTTLGHYQQMRTTAELLKADPLPPFWRKVQDSGDAIVPSDAAV